MNIRICEHLHSYHSEEPLQIRSSLYVGISNFTPFKNMYSNYSSWDLNQQIWKYYSINVLISFNPFTQKRQVSTVHVKKAPFASHMKKNKCSDTQATKTSCFAVIFFTQSRPIQFSECTWYLFPLLELPTDTVDFQRTMRTNEWWSVRPTTDSWRVTKVTGAPHYEQSMMYLSL